MWKVQLVAQGKLHYAGFPWYRLHVMSMSPVVLFPVLPRFAQFSMEGVLAPHLVAFSVTLKERERFELLYW